MPAAPCDEPGPGRRRKRAHARRAAPEIPPPDSGLDADVVIGNIVKAGSRATAWFVLPPVAWSFRSREERFGLILAQTAQLAQLTGRRCQIRVTSRPFPIREWAERLYQDVREHNGPAPGPCKDHPYRSDASCPACRPGQPWLDWLMDWQIRMGRWAAGEKVVYLGVDLWSRSIRHMLAPPGRGGRRDEVPQALRQKMLVAAAEVADIVAGPGLGAVPASDHDMQWLFERGCHLHLPAPALAPRPAGQYALPEPPPHEMGQEQLAGFTEGFPWTVEPFARTVTVTHRDGSTRHVAVLTVKDVDKQPNPPESPWLQRLDKFGFPAEAVITFDVLYPQLVKRVMGRKVNLIREQTAMFGEHSQQPPLALERQNAQARQVEDEAEHGDPVLAAKVNVWARIAVAGETRPEALSRAGEVIRELSPHIQVHHPGFGQYRLAREFIPGQPLGSQLDGIETMPARLLASGMPAVTATVGDRAGFPLGVTSRLAARPVTWHPHHGIERPPEKSGAVTITGALGSGKTTLGGLLAYMEVRAGVPTVILDPSALLHHLCALPELARHSVAVNLLDSAPGTLCPYALIANPRLQDFAFDDEGDSREPAEAERLWRRECLAAEVRRRSVVKDILRMLLPPETVDKDRRDALNLAVIRAPAAPASSPSGVIEVLRDLKDHGLARDAFMIAAELEEMASHPWARLFFPPAGDGDTGGGDILAGGRLLTVMTLKGLVLPKDSRPRSEWTDDERLSVPILHLAAYLTRRHVLDRDRHVRKALLIDEAHALAHNPLGHALLSDLAARDSRKHNLLTILVSQLAQDMQAAGLPGLVGASFTGRTDDEAEQAAALALAGLPAGRGHEAVLASLSVSALGPGSPKEFLFADGQGGTEVVAIDLGPSSALRQALSSTPTGRAAVSGPGPVPPPALAAAAVKGGTS
jgi:AAA-like domain